MGNATSKQQKRGLTNNPGGRPRGVPNKASLMVREIVSKHVAGEPVEHLLKIIDHLSDQEKAEHYQRLMPYMYPKLSQVEHTGAIETNHSENIEKLADVLLKMKSE